MSITSLIFILSFSCILALYAVLPERYRRFLLLAVSLCFVCTYDVRGLFFIFLTSLSVWLAGRKMAAIQESAAALPKGEARKRTKRVMLAALMLNLGFLVVLKYLAPLFGPAKSGPFRLLIPLGISYYTLQAIGYVVDVYGRKIKAEPSYTKVLLFLCYFPQMLQGPISRYKDLSRELYGKEHAFSARNLKHGVQLMLWGYFKIMVISERASEMVESIFYGGQTAYGLTVFLGFVLFGVQLYGNFSGGVDVVRGVSECFGIVLPENFRQPFFSKSLAEFWRRWHITLGTWAKDYLFFPLSLSRPAMALTKKLKGHMSRRAANRVPAAFINIVIFLLVGIWHGTGTNYAIWGLYNGIILAFSDLMTDVYAVGRKKFHIDKNSKAWGAFCVFRTFLIVTLGWCTDCASSAGGSLALVHSMFLVGKTNLAIVDVTLFSGLIFALSVGVLIAVSWIHEKKGSVRAVLDEKPFWVQVIFWTVLIQAIACLKVESYAGGLMYANF